MSHRLRNERPNLIVRQRRPLSGTVRNGTNVNRRNASVRRGSGRTVHRGNLAVLDSTRLGMDNLKGHTGVMRLVTNMSTDDIRNILGVVSTTGNQLTPSRRNGDYRSIWKLGP